MKSLTEIRSNIKGFIISFIIILIVVVSGICVLDYYDQEFVRGFAVIGIIALWFNARLLHFEFKDFEECIFNLNDKLNKK